MAARSLASKVGVAPACRALGVSRSTFYRRARPAPGRRQPRPAPARALSKVERERVEATLASPRFVDRSPAEVVATLLDLFSRYAVGWMVADRENSALAQRLIEETCLKHGVEPDVLTLHSDRGAPMTSQGTAQLLARLGVNRSLGRPRVSDDNPYSEAQFKTLKYHPGFPRRFPDQDAATAYCRSFFPWYNTRTPPCRHRHADPRNRPLRPGPGRARPAPARPERRLETPPRTIRRRRTGAQTTAPSRLDQQARPRNIRNGSVNPQSSCVKVVDRFRYGCLSRSVPGEGTGEPPDSDGIRSTISDP